MKKKILLFLALVAVLSLSGCSSLISFLNATDRTLQSFQHLVNNSKANYDVLQRDLGIDSAQDTTSINYYHY